MPLHSDKIEKRRLYDVAIIGGGLVGASFARAISDLGLHVVLIDRSPGADLYKSSLDNRGLAVSYTTKQILANLGVWPLLESNASAIEHVHISEQHSFGFTKLSSATYNLSALGYVISASNLGAALISDLELLPTLTSLRPATISELHYDEGTATWQIGLNEQTIQAKLLIAADGSNSVVRKMQNITVNVKNYQQLAVVTNIKISAKNLATAYERFTSKGVLALLPFGRNQVKCIWTVGDAQLNEMMQLSDQQFLNEVQLAIGFRLGKLISMDVRHAFPITYSYVDKLYGPGMLLLGNAANTLHPVAAQGFNLGIRDAFTLAQVLRQVIAAKEAINSMATLNKYAALRAADHNKTRNFSNNIVEIFAHDLPLIKISRRLGLVATQLLPLVKSRIVTQGMGLWM